MHYLFFEVMELSIIMYSLFSQQISKFKAHITELNLHAEAQACEYKQKVGHPCRVRSFLDVDISVTIDFKAKVSF